MDRRSDDATLPWRARPESLIKGYRRDLDVLESIVDDGEGSNQHLGRWHAGPGLVANAHPTAAWTWPGARPANRC